MRNEFCMRLTQEHIDKIKAWEKQCYYEYFSEFPNARGASTGVPAQGACGGGITYCITPTSIGDVWGVEMQLGTRFRRSLYLDSDV